MAAYKITRVTSGCVCVCACLSALSPSQVLFDFDETWQTSETWNKITLSLAVKIQQVRPLFSQFIPFYP